MPAYKKQHSQLIIDIKNRRKLWKKVKSEFNPITMNGVKK